MNKFAAFFFAIPCVLFAERSEINTQNDMAFEDDASFEEKLFQEIGGDDAEIALDDEEARRLFEAESGMISMSDEKDQEIERSFN